MTDEVRRSLARLHELMDEIGALVIKMGGAPSEGGPREATGPGAERFDYSNRMHRLAVHEHFDRLEINEKRQGWFLNRGLIGVRLSDLADIIERENAEFLRRYPPKPFRVGRGDGSKSNWDGGWRGRS